MTKTIVLGQKEKKTKQLTPICIEHFINDQGEMDLVSMAVSEYKFATLLCKAYSHVDFNEDLILLHDTENPSDEPNNTVLCTGRWNDGVA